MEVVAALHQRITPGMWQGFLGNVPFGLVNRLSGSNPQKCGSVRIGDHPPRTRIFGLLRGRMSDSAC
jgi:hypothetical protein